MQRYRLTPFDVALYIVVVFSWGFSWIALHYQVGPVAPSVSVMWRFALAAPLMLGLAALRGEQLRFPARDHLLLAGMGLTLFCVNLTLFYYGGAYIASGLLAVVFSLASVINVWLGVLILKAPAERRVVIGGALGTLGIALMFYPQLAQTQLNADALIGFALCVGGTLSFCFGNLLSAQLHRRGIPLIAACGYGMIYGVAALAVFSALRGYSFAIETTATYLGGMIYLALIASVVAFSCYLTLLGRIGADRAAYSTVMFPLVALAVSTAFEGYHWTLPAVAGLVLVLAGNLLVLRPAKASG